MHNQFHPHLLCPYLYLICVVKAVIHEASNQRCFPHCNKKKTTRLSYKHANSIIKIYIYRYICMYVCMYIYIYIYVHVHVSIRNYFTLNVKYVSREMYHPFSMYTQLYQQPLGISQQQINRYPTIRTNRQCSSIISKLKQKKTIFKWSKSVCNRHRGTDAIYS